MDISTQTIIKPPTTESLTNNNFNLDLEAPSPEGNRVFKQAFDQSQLHIFNNNSFYGKAFNIVSFENIDFAKLSSLVFNQMDKIKKKLNGHLDSLVNEPVDPEDALGLFKKQMTGEILTLELETASKVMGKMVENMYTLIRQ